jgi:hypothetical protein
MDGEAPAFPAVVLVATCACRGSSTKRRRRRTDALEAKRLCGVLIIRSIGRGHGVSKQSKERKKGRQGEETGNPKSQIGLSNLRFRIY